MNNNVKLMGLILVVTLLLMAGCSKEDGQKEISNRNVTSRTLDSPNKNNDVATKNPWYHQLVNIS